MLPVVIDRTIVYGDVKILVARDEAQRCFIGLNTGPRLRSDFVFVQVHPSTVAQIEAHEVDLHTVIGQRRMGLVFQARRHEVLQAACDSGAADLWFPRHRAALGAAEGRPG